MVFKKGCCVYEKGALEKGQADMQAEIQEQRSLSVGDFPEHFYHSVQCREAEKEDFQIKAEDPSAAFAEVNVIKISDFGTATTPVKKRLSIKNGNICWKEAGLSLAVVYERYGKMEMLPKHWWKVLLRSREQQLLPGPMTATIFL